MNLISGNISGNLASKPGYSRKDLKDSKGIVRGLANNPRARIWGSLCELFCAGRPSLVNILFLRATVLSALDFMILVALVLWLVNILS